MKPEHKKKSDNILIISWASANVMQQGIMSHCGEQGLIVHSCIILSISHRLPRFFNKREIYCYIKCSLGVTEIQEKSLDLKIELRGAKKIFFQKLSYKPLKFTTFIFSRFIMAIYYWNYRCNRLTVVMSCCSHFANFDIIFSSKKYSSWNWEYEGIIR